MNSTIFKYEIPIPEIKIDHPPFSSDEETIKFTIKDPRDIETIWAIQSHEDLGAQLKMSFVVEVIPSENPTPKLLPPLIIFSQRYPY